MKTISIRTFQDGDETFLCRLFNDCYGGFNGFSPKDTSSWKRSFLDHPKIGAGRILVCQNDSTCGYIAYGNDGTIYDLCVSKSNRQGNVYKELLTTGLKHASEDGINDFSISIPGKSKFMHDTLKELGFIETQMNFIMAIEIINMPLFIERLMKEAQRKVKFRYPLSFKITRDFKPKTKDLPNHYSARYDFADQQENLDHKPVIIECGWLCFGDLILSMVSFWELFLRRKLKIHPWWRVFSFYRIIASIRLSDQWFIPSIDQR